MKKIEGIKQLSNRKYINLFEATYDVDGKKVSYDFVSRKDLANDLHNTNVDAVRILPYIKDGNSIKVVLIKEFRYTINDYIYSTPAGLIDKGETPREAAIREAKEEIGATVVNITDSFIGYPSVGLSNEIIQCFDAEVKLDKKQKLDEIEDISIEIVELKDIIDFINTHSFCLQSSCLLSSFYYKNIRR